CETDDAVVECRAAAQDQVAAIGIGVGQLPVIIGVKMQALVTHEPSPRLGVMHGRGARPQSQHRPNGALIGKMIGHFTGPFHAVVISMVVRFRPAARGDDVPTCQGLCATNPGITSSLRATYAATPTATSTDSWS